MFQPAFDLSTYFALIMKLLTFFFFVGIVYVSYRVIKYSLFYAIKNRNLPAKSIDGLNLILRLFSLLIIFALFLAWFINEPTITLSFTTVIGIIIGFASTEIVNQIVLGMYIISSEPFRVNDLVNINDIEGIVSEIGINYTTLERFDGVVVRLPNKMVMSSKIRNFTSKLGENQQQYPFQMQNDTQGDSTVPLRDFFSMVRNPFKQSQLTHYTFTINVEYDLSPQEVRKRIDRVCDKYKHVFKYRPQYSLIGLSWRPTILFELFSINPYIILHNYYRFIGDLSLSLDENRGG